MALEFVSADCVLEPRAVIDPDTGEVHFWSSDDIDEAVPLPDIDSADRYIELPGKRDLGLGRALVLSFVRQEIPTEYDTVAEFFEGKGAYRRFKGFLESRDLLRAWYAHEARETEKALRLWCEENDIDVVDPPPEGTA